MNYDRSVNFMTTAAEVIVLGYDQINHIRISTPRNISDKLSI